MMEATDAIILRRMLQALDGIDPSLPKRTYTIQASPDVLARLERFLSYVEWCSGVGHSCDIRFSIDGDGADRFKVVFGKLPKVSEEDGLAMEVPHR